MMKAQLAYGGSNAGAGDDACRRSSAKGFPFDASASCGGGPGAEFYFDILQRCAVMAVEGWMNELYPIKGLIRQLYPYIMIK